MKLNLNNFEKSLIAEISLKFEIDTLEYIDELDRLVDGMSNLKGTLKRGKLRHRNRKEIHRIQSAIEAVRFIKRKSERRIAKKQMLTEGGAKVPHENQANLDPNVVTQSVSLYEDLMRLFNEYLSSIEKTHIKLVKPVGSTAYYKEDLEQDSKVVYGDIDYLVSLPSAQSKDSLGNERKDQASIEREYTKHFLDFLRSSAPKYVDLELTGDISPTMVILTLGDGKKVQVDLIATVDKYTKWMETRWVPERGIKGYIAGNLYKALGDTLLLTIGDQGVLARIKDGKRVSSKNRGKNVTFTQVSTSPKTFFKDIVSYISGDSAIISPNLTLSQGMNPDMILISDIAKGILNIAENLQNNNSLPVRFSNSSEMLEEVLARFKIAIDASVEKKAKGTASGNKMSKEKINKLVKMNAEQYNNVKNEFNL